MQQNQQTPQPQQQPQQQPPQQYPYGQPQYPYGHPPRQHPYPYGQQPYGQQPYNPYPYQPQPKKKFPVWAWIIIAIIVIGIGGAAINNISSGGTTNLKNTSAKKETKKDYIAQCIKIPFNDIMRNPNKYTGKRIKVRGEISQYIEGGVLTEEMFTLYEDYERDWDDKNATYHDKRWIIIMKQPDEDRILVDDIVEFYGEFTGLQKVKTILGESRTEPRLEVAYYTILKKGNK